MSYTDRAVEYRPTRWSGHKKGRYIEYISGEIDRTDGSHVDLHSFLTAHCMDIVLMRVRSNVMRASGLHKGSFMLVDKAAKPKRGNIVIVLYNGQRVVRRLEKIVNSWALVPDDPRVKTIYLQSYDHVIKIGVVVKAIIDLKEQG